MTSGYNVGVACTRGHTINGSSTEHPEADTAFCARCGAKAINACPSCGEPLRGVVLADVAVRPRSWAPAAYCHACGQGLPWTEELLAAAGELVNDASNLTDEDRQLFNESLRDLTSDTPRTVVAASRVRRILSKAGVGVGNDVRDVMRNIATEAAQKAIWP